MRRPKKVTCKGLLFILLAELFLTIQEKPKLETKMFNISFPSASPSFFLLDGMTDPRLICLIFYLLFLFVVKKKMARKTAKAAEILKHVKRRSDRLR